MTNYKHFKFTNETFRDAVHKKFPEIDVSKAEYINSRTPTIFVCPKHGEFEQTPEKILSENTQNRRITAIKPGCNICANIEINRQIFEEIENEYNFGYFYPDTDAKKYEKITVVCPKHKEFTTSIKRLKNGTQCRKCSIEQQTQQQTDDIDIFVEKSRGMHKDTYNYSNSIYQKSNKYIEIICPKHGSFMTKPYKHIQGQGCPKCAINKAEKEIVEIIGENVVEIHNKKILEGKEIDIYVPEYNFGIEYNGLLWHSIGTTGSSKTSRPDTKENKYQHLYKTELAETKGMQLFHIFENEWLNPIKKDIWISMFKDKMHKNIKIGARKTEIRYVESKEAKIFQEENHLQGSGKSKIKIGLYYNNALVSLMTFSKGRNTISGKFEYELIRFCNKRGHTIQGGASKLLKFFEREHKPKSLVSFANRRWSMGNLYKKLGFELSHISAPNYFYFKNKGPLYSRNKFQKHKLKDILETFDASKTEWQNMDINGYRKIYDCGNYVFMKKYECDFEMSDL